METALFYTLLSDYYNIRLLLAMPAKRVIKFFSLVYYLIVRGTHKSYLFTVDANNL